MKKALAVLAVAAALALTFGGTLTVAAQGRGDWAGGRGMGRGGWTERATPPGGGVLGGAMDPYLADALGMSVEDFQAARESGLTLYQIALEQGIEAAELPGLMEQARTGALEAAVKAGEITQEQADWMAQRGGGFGGKAFGGRGGFGGHGGACPNGYEPGTMGRWSGSTSS